MPRKKSTAVAVVGPVSAMTDDAGAGAKPAAANLEKRPPVVATVAEAGSIPATGSAVVSAVVRLRPKLLPLGLHFNLDAARYHADPALGSTNLKQLAKNPFNYWYASWMNPLREPEEDTESRKVGRAIHKLVFEGRDAFDADFVCGPDQTGMTSGQKGTSTKAAKAEEAAGKGRTLLSMDRFNRVMLAGAMITKNPYLAKVFSAGAPEVSFFWEREGVRLKARFDYLKCGVRSAGDGRSRFMLAANGDLKTVANQYENDFEAECYNAIANYRYDAQAAHYMDGLTMVPEAIRNDFVFGAQDIQSEWLERFLDPDLRFAWQWIFHQTTGAPITHSMTLSPQNPILETGRQVVSRGIARYRECMDRFGTDEMWLLAEEPNEAMMESMPGWFGRR